MWYERTAAVLAEPVERISVRYDADSGRPIVSGRLVVLEDETYALGRFIAEGDEAFVFELINVHNGERERVVKICRHQPGSEKYAVWAVPFRVPGNRLSMLADVELNTARLMKVDDGYVKVQRYFAGQGIIDWGARRTVLTLTSETARLPVEDALARVNSVIAHYGRRGLLVELQGRLLAQAERWEEARTLLEEAVVCFRTERSSLRLEAAMLLASVYYRIYVAENRADAAVTLKLGDQQLTQQVFMSVEAAALDDTLQDRALFMVLEAVAEEPLFVPGLLYLAHDYFQSAQLSLTHALLDRVDRIDPGNEQAAALRTEAGSLPQTEPDREPAYDAPAREAPEVPASLRERVASHAELYKPEAGLPKFGEGRRVAIALLMSQSQFDEALAAAEEWLSIEPASIDAQRAKAEALLYAERHVEAQATADAALSAAPDDPSLLLLLAHIHLAQHQSESALRYALLASHDPGFWREAADCAARCYRSLGDRAHALEFAERAFADDRGNDRRIQSYKRTSERCAGRSL